MSHDTRAAAPEKVRLDKWLWAARIYKTRTIAKQAIEGGKVQVSGQRAKAGKEITVGTVLTVRQGYDERVITVLGLSEQRRGAPEARLLYEESEESIRKREALAEQRKLQADHLLAQTRPNKKERRLRQAMKGRFD